MDIDVDVDPDLDIDRYRYVGVSIGWRSFEKGFRAPLKGLELI